MTHWVNQWLTKYLAHNTSLSHTYYLFNLEPWWSHQSTNASTSHSLPKNHQIESSLSLSLCLTSNTHRIGSLLTNSLGTFNFELIFNNSDGAKYIWSCYDVQIFLTVNSGGSLLGWLAGLISSSNIQQNINLALWISLGLRLYFTVYPSSCHNTGTVVFSNISNTHCQDCRLCRMIAVYIRGPGILHVFLAEKLLCTQTSSAAHSVLAWIWTWEEQNQYTQIS